jgi:hypothetical protein
VTRYVFLHPSSLAYGARHHFVNLCGLLLVGLDIAKFIRLEMPVLKVKVNIAHEVWFRFVWMGQCKRYARNGQPIKHDRGL